MRLTLSERTAGLRAVVIINRPGSATERLPLLQSEQNQHSYVSTVAPAEPHEFDAELELVATGQKETLAFHMAEPEGHHH